MTKKQCIIIGIISAILTAVFLYAGYYFPHRLLKFLFFVVTIAFCFGFFLLDHCNHLDKRGDLAKSIPCYLSV